MPRRSRDRLRHLALLTPSCGGRGGDREQKRVIHGDDNQARSKRNSLTPTPQSERTLSAIFVRSGAAAFFRIVAPAVHETPS
jgi:hypothetical protein